MIETFRVTEEEEGRRVDVYLAGLLEGRSRSYLQKLIKDGALCCNGKTVKASALIRSGDEIRLDLPENVLPKIEAEDIPLDIVYEDGDLLVVNKPKGMVVHPAPGHYTGTLVNALMHHCGDLSGINGVLRPGIVHRIDRDTTGLLIVCKNDQSHNGIAAQLKEHSVERTYHAIAAGVFNDKSGTVDAPIGRDTKDRLKMAICPDGKPAITHFTVLEQFEDSAYIACRLETGRTHQIRVHMSSIGHPLIGDEIYGKKSRFQTCGQVLHAKTIGFKHPGTGEWMQFDSGLPGYFEEILRALRSGKSA